MAPITARAARDIALMADYHIRLQHHQALRDLADAIGVAQAGIPKIMVHRAAPTPYPQVARPGTFWVKFGRYWFAYGTRSPHVIRMIIYKTINRPSRI